MNKKRLTTVFPGAIVLLAIFGFALFIWTFSAPVSASAKKGEKNGSNFAPEAVFPGTGVGPIPDGGAACGPSPGQSLDISFLVSGINSAPSSISVSLTFGSPNHTYIGDIEATLYSPDGTPHLVFGRTGSITATGFGDSSDLGATYVFSDSAAAPPSGGWWQEATVRAATEVMTAGTYRTTGLGGAGQVNPAPATNMNAAFSGIPTSNGTWLLTITDGCEADTGAVTAASLTLTGGAVQTQHVADFNGDGKTDFIVARATSTGFSEATSQDMPSIWNGFENRGETKEHHHWFHYFFAV